MAAKQASLDSLNSQIDGLYDAINNLDFLDSWKAVGYGSQIAVLEGYKRAASAALSVAQFALQQAESALGSQGILIFKLILILIFEFCLIYNISFSFLFVFSSS